MAAALGLVVFAVYETALAFEIGPGMVGAKQEQGLRVAAALAQETGEVWAPERTAAQNHSPGAGATAGEQVVGVGRSQVADGGPEEVATADAGAGASRRLRG